MEYLSKQCNILVVDDESYTRELFTNLLIEKCYKIITVSNGYDALKKCREEEIDIVFLDLKMPHMDGLTVLKHIKSLDSNIAVIIMTGHGTVESAVDAMKLGAFDYLTKPFINLDEIKIVIEKTIAHRLLLLENIYLRGKLEDQFRITNIIGKSDKIMEIFNLINKIAPLDTTVLIRGESGTGKELIANTIHQLSKRNNKRFIPVNCSAIPENLLESSMFGHEKGAFTGAYKSTKGFFEEADEGTLFLDEVGELPLNIQVKLLRAIQERCFQRVGSTADIKVDIRLIAATNKDLEEEIKNGRFREDLFYRLNVISILIPSLRERMEDLPLLIKHFLDKYNKKLNKSVKKVSSEAIECLTRYSWRGNIRELENAIERAIALSDNDIITPENLPPSIFKKGDSSFIDYSHMPFSVAKEEFEKKYLMDVLRNTNGNVSHAAEFSGIPRQNLHLKIKRYDIDIDQFRT